MPKIWEGLKDITTRVNQTREDITTHVNQSRENIMFYFEKYINALNFSKNYSDYLIIFDKFSI